MMMDRLTVEQRSQLMSKIRGKNTTPERYLFAAASAAGLKYLRHVSSLPGKPDLVIAKARLAVFVDGDFWHGYRFPRWKEFIPDFWQLKIGENRRRDARNHRKLRRLGWKVCRVWEHEIESDVIACVERVAALAGRQTIDISAVEIAMAALPRLRRRNRLPKRRRLDI